MAAFTFVKVHNLVSHLAMVNRLGRKICAFFHNVRRATLMILYVKSYESKKAIDIA